MVIIIRTDRILRLLPYKAFRHLQRSLPQPLMRLLLSEALIVGVPVRCRHIVFLDLRVAYHHHIMTAHDALSDTIHTVLVMPLEYFRHGGFLGAGARRGDQGHILVLPDVFVLTFYRNTPTLPTMRWR